MVTLPESLSQLHMIWLSQNSFPMMLFTCRLNKLGSDTTQEVFQNWEYFTFFLLCPRKCQDNSVITHILESLHEKTYLHWIPGHLNIPGNEYADKAAKEAAQLPDLEQEQTPIPYGVARAVAKSNIKNGDLQHHLVSQFPNLQRIQQKES